MMLGEEISPFFRMEAAMCDTEWFRRWTEIEAQEKARRETEKLAQQAGKPAAPKAPAGEARPIPEPEPEPV